MRLPQAGGLAVAGTVVAAGPHTSVEVGCRVVALMEKRAYAQLAVADEALCAVVDDDADMAALAGSAAQAPCAHLLLHASTTLRAGESLLVHGAAGGLGSLAVQIAKALGAGPVIGRASTAQRREFVMALGVDVVIESIGGEVFWQNFDALATFGRYLLLGSTRGPGEPFAPRRLTTRLQALIGFYLAVFYERPELIGNALRFLADGIKTGQITSQVDEVLPLCQAAEAHRRLESREVRGVIALDPTIES